MYDYPIRLHLKVDLNVLVGAGVVMGWVGTLVVDLVAMGRRATARVPTPHPNLSRPYGNEICIYIIKQFTYSVPTHLYTFHDVPSPEPDGHPPIVRLGEEQGCNY